MNLLLDTNIIIDYFGRRKPYYNDWYKLDVMRELGDATLWVSAQSFSDSFYLLSKIVDPSQLQAAFTESLEIFNICPVGGKEIKLAALRCWPDFEDSVINICAENIKADYIITRDKKGFTQSRIPSFSPQEFFVHLETEYGLIYDEVD